MAASIQAQPPKPPPPPPKVEAAPKPAVEAKPASQGGASAASAPKPAQTPDMFETASGGGRALPTNGGSSFAPAIGAARSTVTDAVNGAKSNLQSVFGSLNDATRQTGFQMDPNAVTPADLGGDPLSMLGGLGDVRGGGGGMSMPSPYLANGGAAGGVGDRGWTSLNLGDTFSRNFGPSFGPPSSEFLDNPGGGGKPGIGGSTDFLNQLGGGALPFATTTPQPAIATQPSNDSGRRNPFDFDFGGFGGPGFRFGLFNFGSARGGGGGAAGGVADRGGQ